MATVIDRCKTEGIVDVFQVVKALRTFKPGAVPTMVSSHIYAWKYEILVKGPAKDPLPEIHVTLLAQSPLPKHRVELQLKKIVLPQKFGMN